ncbi:hypothetical protein QMK33_00245 [Hymenobacter sp. H14-R3]|uniref:hypothetical protein n=1 Tax=Hymenobacter sp. H14-R3 TaxID=3046308 RepID=UPI0024BA3F41|nr:hypothetical protein [Hymenobacter sp. H14-R3]MDJ0363563.1 hypothetical protein [Hymenobacter sp. H14-R3]
MIDTLVSANLISGRKNSALNVRNVLAGVSDAIGFLEGLQRGARILSGTTPPSGADGMEGDAYILTTTSDFYLRDATNGWQLQFRLKGADGKTPKKGTDYFDGRTPVKGTDFFDGNDGKNAFQLWQADSSANTGTVTQWLASLIGKAGDPGKAGNVNQWKSYAPTTEPGQPGDAWFHTVSATKLAIYECVASGTWGLRFTSPDAAASTVVTQPTTGGTGTVKSVNGTLPDANGNVTIQAGGGASSVTLVQTIGAGNATDIPSTAAVAGAVAGILVNHEILVAVTQTTTRVPLYFRRKVLVVASAYSYSVASLVYTLSYLDQNGDETKYGPFNSTGGGSGLNAAINALTDSVVANYGFTVYVDYVLKPGRSSAEASITIQPTA